MDFFEKTKWDRSVFALIYLVLGVVLLLFPEQTLTIATRIIALAIIILAALNIIQFIVNKEERFSANYFFLILSIVGIGVVPVESRICIQFYPSSRQLALCRSFRTGNSMQNVLVCDKKVVGICRGVHVSFYNGSEV